MNRAFCLVSLALLLVTLSCVDDGPIAVSSADIDGPREGKSLTAVIENFAFAYRSRDIELYRSLLDPRLEIRFPEDVSSPLEPDESWYDWEVRSTKNMFDGSDWIQCRFTVDPPRPSGVEGYAASDGFLETVVRDLDIQCSIPGTEDTFYVTDDSILFVLAPDRPEAPSSWQIICEKFFKGRGAYVAEETGR
jgi:hypothetical protein